MKALILVLAAMVTFSNTVQTAMAASQDTVKIAVGKRASADRGRIKIQFLSVVEDSRCPRHATCVWGGNAKVRVAVSKGRQSRIIELNTDLDPRIETVFGYKFQLGDLNPRNGDASTQKVTFAMISVKKIKPRYRSTHSRAYQQKVWRL